MMNLMSEQMMTNSARLNLDVRPTKMLLTPGTCIYDDQNACYIHYISAITHYC